MTALKILGILAVLVVLVCLLRVGVLLSLEEELTVALKVGFLRFQVFPPPKKAEKPKKESKPKPPKQEKKASSPGFPKPNASDIRDGLKTLWPPLKKALHRTRRGVRIDPLEMSVVLGGAAEPADTAQLYGELTGAVWAGMPRLERLLVIPKPHIHIGMDFDREETQIRGTAGLSARVGTLLRIGLTVAIPALRWMFAYLKRKKKQASLGKDESDGNGQEKPAA